MLKRGMEGECFVYESEVVLISH